MYIYNMVKIRFPNNRERNRGLGFILGKVVIRIFGDKTFGISKLTVKKLRDIHRVNFRIVK